MNTNTPIYRHHQQLDELRELRRSVRRDLWQGRILQALVLGMLLTLLGAIVYRTWPVETLEMIQWAESQVSPFKL